MATTRCGKCAGTGTVTRFLDFKAGVCFDCNGRGTLTSTPRSARTPLAKAAHAGAVALETGEGAQEALAALRDLQLGWGERHYAMARELAELAAVQA